MIIYRNSDIFFDALISKTKKNQVTWCQMPSLANMGEHSIPLKRRIDFLNALDDIKYLPHLSFYTRNNKGIFVLISYKNKFDETHTEAIPIPFALGDDVFPLPLPDFCSSSQDEKIERLLLCIQFQLGFVDDELVPMNDFLDSLI